MSEKEKILKKLENQVLLHLGTTTISKIIKRQPEYNNLKLTERLEINILINRLHKNPGKWVG